jgi:hypothetical protein
MKLDRRAVLRGGGSVGAAVALDPREAFAQAQTNGQEKGRQLLLELGKTPQWRAPQSDATEPGKAYQGFYAQSERFYSERGRASLQAGIDRLTANEGEHVKIIFAAAEKYKVPKDVVYLALAESHWNPFGENRALAAGYWQFIPATARLYGLAVPKGESKARPRRAAELVGDERLDVAKSTDAAMRYLSYLKRFFERVATNNSLTIPENDLWTFAMWAYNRGPGHVRKTFIETRGNPLQYPSTLLAQPITRGDAKAVTAARRESAGYVPKIAAIQATAMRLLQGVVARPAPATPQKKAPEPVPKQVPPPAPTPEPEPPQEVVKESEEDIEMITYRVQGGDNLTKIATWISPDRDFIQFRMDQIRDFNERILGRKLADQVNRNEVLQIPAQRISVAPGDTLEKFARIYRK